MPEYGSGQERHPKGRPSDHAQTASGYQPRVNPPRPQVHQQPTPQAYPQFATTPQDRYDFGRTSAYPATDPRDVTGQQHHEDTFRRSFAHNEASLPRESRPERVPGITPYQDPFQYMRYGASQYLRSFTTRADTGSEAAADPMCIPPYGYRADNGFRNLYGDNWKNTDVQDPSWSHRESAVPERFPTASAGGYPYPQELDISEQPAQRHGNRAPVIHPVANDPNAVAYPNHRVSRPQVPQSPPQYSPAQGGYIGAESQRRRPVQHPPTRGSSFSAPSGPTPGPTPYPGYGRSTQSTRQYERTRGQP